MDETSRPSQEEPTPGGSDWERPVEPASPAAGSPTDEDELREDPETGSTKTDPAAEASGPPLVGDDDPLGGGAASG